ncbi:MAG: endonuclease toxin domain-containing protein [Thermomicrobiales bacterium]
MDRQLDAGEEAEIRREVKRLYYDAGDITGGDALNRAVSDASYAGSSRLARQAILDQYEPYIREDPAEAGQALRDVASLTLLLPTEVAAEIATITGETTTAADVWTLGWAKRGQVIEDGLGRNLPRYFRAIDRFGEDGIAVSIKSIDLNGATYQNFNRLSYTLNRYVDGVADFVGDPLAECPILPEQIKGRELWVAIPPNTFTGARRAAIEAVIERAKNLPDPVTVRVFPY